MRRLKVLVVDDDLEWLSGLSEALCLDYEVLSATSGKEAVELAHKEAPDLALVDLHMANGDGQYFCTEVRSNKLVSGLPIFIISGDSGENIKLKLYELGVDDYIAKPFSLLELRAKIKAKLRDKLSVPVINFAGMSLDLTRQEWAFQDQTKSLSRVETNILHCLINLNTRLVSRAELYQKIWPGKPVKSRIVDVHVANLRKKLPEHLTIKSRYGLGYQIVEYSRNIARGSALP